MHNAEFERWKAQGRLRSLEDLRADPNRFIEDYRRAAAQLMGTTPEEMDARLFQIHQGIERRYPR